MAILFLYHKKDGGSLPKSMEDLAEIGIDANLDEKSRNKRSFTPGPSSKFNE
ncbi:hypothetical protein RND71_011265 [Anisodus tanguticus]|uniref:Uncharacterized protein n=1 Tax=Anisodus tanguticus TaxID=243964 RepID=A0AAE1SDM4_9SOLA|nr:hypothetical protein RND71_011265 [Anisodus tanguticus]